MSFSIARKVSARCPQTMASDIPGALEERCANVRLEVKTIGSLLKCPTDSCIVDAAICISVADGG